MKHSICLIGQVLVDVTLPTEKSPIKMRLGGIIHAARCLWALGHPYKLAYFCPEYLSDQVKQYAVHHGADQVIKLGTVSGSPNVILISEARETGDQGYEYILRDEHSSYLDIDALSQVVKSQISDFVLIPGGFPLKPILRALGQTKARVYSDANFNPYRLSDFRSLGRLFETLILSTSSAPFLKRYEGSVDMFSKEVLGKFANSILLKENRGGSRFFSSSLKPIEVPAYLRTIQHSVGVGDCYDVAFACLRRKYNDNESLRYASLIASEYAATTFPDDFNSGCKRIMQIDRKVIAKLDGVSLRWEDRSKYNIYIAAPDFDYINTSPIEKIVRSLIYHNFTPRRPIKENGQVHDNMSLERRRNIWSKDMKLIQQCHLLIAVLLNNDPGTLIEIGLASQSGKPTIVFDPYGIARNLMLTNLPHLVSTSLDDVVDAVFEITGRMNRESKY